MANTNDAHDRENENGTFKKILSWNVCGLRSCFKKGCIEYLSSVSADIICLNNLKIGNDEIVNEMILKGYYTFWNIKKGRAGVVIFSKPKPLLVTVDFFEKLSPEEESRVVTAEYEEFFLVTCCSVNAVSALRNLKNRIEWLEKFIRYVKQLDAGKPVIIAGDLKVAHTEIDVACPEKRSRKAGYTGIERECFTKLLSCGFTDTFRWLYSDRREAYTYWSFTNMAREMNSGWRMDYFLVSDRYVGKVVDSIIHTEIHGSNHCPIALHVDLNFNKIK